MVTKTSLARITKNSFHAQLAQNHSMQSALVATQNRVAQNNTEPTLVAAQNGVRVSVEQSSRTEVPPYDVCRLSYYLCCATKHCGIELSSIDHLLNYKTAHRLPAEQQENIFVLAATYLGLEVLGNITVFVDATNQLLPQGVSNKWIKIEEFTTLLAVQREAALLGEQTRAHSILICSQSWIRTYYLNPLRRHFGRTQAVETGCQCTIL